MTQPDPIQTFYERWPYPSQPPSLDEYRDRKSVPTACPAATFHLFWPGRTPTDDLTILHAGCGTTQVVAAALWDRRARFVAIDVSKMSIDQTRAMADRYKLTNIEFHCMPLEQVSKLNRQFDLIVCSGVLHHLSDPDAGLRALREVLVRDGSIYIMVYGKLGRVGVYAIQEYCRILGLQPTEGELKDLSQMLEQLPQDHPIRPVLHKARDIASHQGIADLLLNPRDQAYSVPELYQWLDRCDMKLQRWLPQANYLPQCCPLTITPHLGRIRSLPEPSQHAAVELFRGHLNTHSFLACRNDCPRESYEIRFDNPTWRKLVPIVMPTTGSRPVTDRPGYSMQLFDSTHEFPVGNMLISMSQVSLLRLMDGNRSLAQIAAESRQPDAERLTVDLFRQLWDFDHVMFKRIN